MASPQELQTLATRVAALLAAQQTTLVLAESCTGGLVAATLTTVPGISKWLCGSAVVYQVETKARWLGIPADLLETRGPVSAEVAQAMVAGALERTPQAEIAASVTGHLGPGVDSDEDGLMYAAVAVRARTGGATIPAPSLIVREYRLEAGSGAETSGTGDTLRIRRQREAAAFVMSLICTVLESGHSGHSVAT